MSEFPGQSGHALPDQFGHFVPPADISPLVRTVEDQSSWVVEL